MTKKSSGFYVDIGAHHPSRLNNTYYFYRQGWNGINIDAQPGSMDLFNVVRPRDINIEIAISDKAGYLDFYMFGEPGLNSADPETANRRKNNLRGADAYKNTIQIKSDTLSSILDKHCKNHQHIDFFSIDVEGLNLKVLQPNNWDKYQPDHILIESLGESYYSLINSETVKYLDSIGYELISKLVHTAIFRKKITPTNFSFIKKQHVFRSDIIHNNSNLQQIGAPLFRHRKRHRFGSR